MKNSKDVFEFFARPQSRFLAVVGRHSKKTPATDLGERIQGLAGCLFLVDTTSFKQFSLGMFVALDHHGYPWLTIEICSIPRTEAMNPMIKNISTCGQNPDNLDSKHHQ